MKTTGEFYEHRGLIALTGAFFVAVALSGCGNERMNDPQVRPGGPPVSQTEIVIQKEKPFSAGEHPVISAPQQVREAVIIQPMQPAPIKSKSLTLLTKSLTFPEKPAVLPSQPPLASSFAASSSAQCDMTNIAEPLSKVVTILEEKTLLYA
ncbi:MAG: hypothetical protein D3910_20450, partial [Candidatus Electrothrix sp. ATG2]|nr:hypothetical protein [Candidatus Electrothrix sp. ATG2]